MKKLALLWVLGWAGTALGAAPVLAQQVGQPAPAAPPAATPPGAPLPPPTPGAAPATAPPAPGAAAAPAAPPGPTAMSNPTMTGPLVANPNPLKFQADPLGTVYITGVASGLGFAEGNSFATDRSGQFDISNGQVMVQKTDGLFQFYLQAGIYSLPSLGTPYVRATNVVSDFFGALPVAYAKLAPSDSLSVQIGKLPTLIGAEYTFTFQNMNIERGLLWNQEPAISKGIQGNYTAGPVALSLSLNDGFYSGRYNWLTGSATWTINSANTLEVVAGGNFGTTSFLPSQPLATPVPQSNSQIVNLIYTYSAAPWTVTPYFQFTNVPANATLGFPSGAQTYGGAVLANYAFTPMFSLAGRAEIIGSTGSLASGAPNLLYGPGSAAWSLTLTPTFQKGIFFARAEGSIVQAWGTTSGDAFGKSGNAKTQERLMLETGVVF